jgi:peptidoglycan/xylan/chitin deacetylase (PgdA/CDA1 family)
VGRQDFAAEVDRTQEVIERIIGHRPALFRPPYGARWFGMFPALQERGLRVVQWSDSGYDWKGDPGLIAEEALKNLKPGSIILLHDALEGTDGFFAQLGRRLAGKPQLADSQTSPRADRSGTIDALPTIIEGARLAGLDFVGIDEFL